MASIEQRIEHLFPPKRGKGPTSIAMVATIFAERRGQWLTQDNVIILVSEKKKLGISTIRKAFRELSLPIDNLNGHRFIDVEPIKPIGRGGTVLKGKISDAAIQKIFQLVTPVNQEPPSYFIKDKSLLAQLTRL